MKRIYLSAVLNIQDVVCRFVHAGVKRQKEYYSRQNRAYRSLDREDGIEKDARVRYLSGMTTQGIAETSVHML